MPAFGSLTGGLDAHHPEILGSVGGNAAALVPVSDRLLRFPAGGLGRLDLDRHCAGRRQHQPRRRRTALAEGRGLKLVARGVAVELEALRLGRGASTGRDARRGRRCPPRGRTSSSLQGRSSPPFIVGPAAKDKPRDCATVDGLFLNRPHEMLASFSPPRRRLVAMPAAAQPIVSPQGRRRGSTGSSRQRP